MALLLFLVTTIANGTKKLGSSDINPLHVNWAVKLPSVLPPPLSLPTHIHTETHTVQIDGDAVWFMLRLCASCIPLLLWKSLHENCVFFLSNTNYNAIVTATRDSRFFLLFSVQIQQRSRLLTTIFLLMDFVPIDCHLPVFTDGDSDLSIGICVCVKTNSWKDG